MPTLDESEHERFLSEHYDLLYAAHLWFAANPGTGPAETYGDTASEKLKTINWRRWCEHASLSTKFCRLCVFPMDPPEVPDDLCLICAALERTLGKRVNLAWASSISLKIELPGQEHSSSGGASKQAVWAAWGPNSRLDETESSKSYDIAGVCKVGMVKNVVCRRRYSEADALVNSDRLVER